MYYIESSSTEPEHNLALEHHFLSMPGQDDYFMLWQNKSAVIIGRHQNTMAEVDDSYAKSHGISVVRRLSGGGAVYHDLGNLNFTFIADRQKGSDFAHFCSPVIDALAFIGVNAEISGRNDMTIDGKKFSGNAQFCHGNRIMHHGTILFDSDLDVVTKVLTVSKDKIESKGLSSVRSRVTNIKEHLRTGDGVNEFKESLRRFMFKKYNLADYVPSRADIEQIGKLRKDYYESWDWNYGHSPACNLYKKRRIPLCGSIEIYLNVDKGRIKDCAFTGDFFSKLDPQELAKKLLGTRLEEKEIFDVLAALPVEDYFINLEASTLAEIIFA